MQFAVIGMAPMNTKTYFDSYIKPAFGAGSHRHRQFADISPTTLIYTLRQVRARQWGGGEGSAAATAMSASHPPRCSRCAVGRGYST